jgi:hypothetical protein
MTPREEIEALWRILIRVSNLAWTLKAEVEK